MKNVDGARSSTVDDKHLNTHKSILNAFNLLRRWTSLSVSKYEFYTTMLNMVFFEFSFFPLLCLLLSFPSQVTWTFARAWCAFAFCIYGFYFFRCFHCDFFPIDQIVIRLRIIASGSGDFGQQFVLKSENTCTNKHIEHMHWARLER